ncbi:MAG: hypothetical protein ACI90V_010358, partial [Bacillariaceae sp.]
FRSLINFPPKNNSPIPPPPPPQEIIYHVFDPLQQNEKMCVYEAHSLQNDLNGWNKVEV